MKKPLEFAHITCPNCDCDLVSIAETSLSGHKYSLQRTFYSASAVSSCFGRNSEILDTITATTVTPTAAQAKIPPRLPPCLRVSYTEKPPRRTAGTSTTETAITFHSLTNTARIKKTHAKIDKTENLVFCCRYGAPYAIIGIVGCCSCLSNSTSAGLVKVMSKAL